MGSPAFHCWTRPEYSSYVFQGLNSFILRRRTTLFQRLVEFFASAKFNQRAQWWRRTAPKNTLAAKIHTLKDTAQLSGTSIPMPRTPPVRLVFVAVNLSSILERELPLTRRCMWPDIACRRRIALTCQSSGALNVSAHIECNFWRYPGCFDHNFAQVYMAFRKATSRGDQH